MDVDLAVVILNYGKYPSVMDTLKDVRRQKDLELRILFVDNGTPMAPPEHVLHLADYYLRLNRNAGYADGMNRGIAALPSGAYRHVLLLTHDVRLPNTLVIKTMLDYIRAHPAVGVVGPQLVLPDGRRWSTGGQLTRWTWSGRHGESQRINDHAATEAAWLDGSCLLYSNEALREVGPFDTDYFLYYEELDHHHRLRQLGYKVACVTTAVVEQSTGGAPRYRATRNHILFLRKSGQLSRAVLVTGRELVRMVILALKERSRMEAPLVYRGIVDSWTGKDVRSADE